MLLLKRRRDQVVKIGPDVTVHVVRIENGAVLLGITAPKGWTVSRDEHEPEGTDHADKTIRSTGNDGISRPAELNEASRRDVAESERA